MAAALATILVVVISVFGALLYYWYKCSFKPYIFNNGLKFKLPPHSVYPFTHRWLSLTNFDHIWHPKNCTDPCLHYIDEQPTNQAHHKNNLTFLFLHGNPTWSVIILVHVHLLTPCQKVLSVSQNDQKITRKISLRRIRLSRFWVIDSLKIIHIHSPRTRRNRIQIGQQIGFKEYNPRSARL